MLHLDKIADLQKDVRETKRDLKDAMDDKESFETKYIDVLESLEMMTLDKEVAEERAESLQLEISILTDKIEEISVDLDILRKESGKSQYNQHTFDANLMHCAFLVCRNDESSS